MKRREAMRIVGELQSMQWRLCTTSQVKRRGVSKEMLGDLTKLGAIGRIGNGAYAAPGVPVTPEIEVKAEWLDAQPDMTAMVRLADYSLAGDVVVSHTTAAFLYGIGDLWPGGIHFTSPTRKKSNWEETTFHEASLGRDEWVVHKLIGLPITTVTRTLKDLAEAGYEDGHIDALIMDSVALWA